MEDFSTKAKELIDFEDDDPLGATGVSRKSLVIFFLIDTSGSMKGTKMGELNTAMEELMPEIRSIGEADTDIKIAVLTFSTGCAWMYPEPISVEEFEWARLEAKGKDYGCKIIKADRYFPSSQLCSNCGFQFNGLTLSMREWTCKCCGTHHIRDVNAAINLKNYIRQEVSEFKPVESSKVANLAMLALQATELVEAGSHSQATSDKNVLS